MRAQTLNVKYKLGICYKRKFSTERAAKAALKKARSSGCCSYYQCGICGNYHLTSQRQYK